ncbi:MAG: hypothetical protein ACK43M_22170 [Allorhizobium sp.]
MAAAIAHADEKIDDGPLEEGGTLRQNALQQVRLQGLMQYRLCGIDLFFRRRGSRCIDGLTGAG